jgi:hypothetical protein
MAASQAESRSKIKSKESEERQSNSKIESKKPEKHFLTLQLKQGNRPAPW